MPARDALLRLNDYYEVYSPANPTAAQNEGGRCMNCGAAFCMPDSGYGQGCPIDNKIPEWNELVRLGRWEDAYHRLSETNPFPEFTSRVCPAPCQDACILGINEHPVQIKGIERAIIDRAFQEGWVKPTKPEQRRRQRVAIVGSGPAGLGAATELNRMGYRVTVFERSDRPGGLLRYGVPNMKLDKAVLDRRIDLVRKSGVCFEVNCEIGRDIQPDSLRQEYDAVLLACGAKRPRDLDLPGRHLDGIHQAMDYLTASMKALNSGEPPVIDAHGKRVVVIGAGDTGADCIATALRQGASGVINLANGPSPPAERTERFPWPGPKGTLRTDYAHQEAKSTQGQDPRQWQATTLSFASSQSAPDKIDYINVQDESGQTRRISADLVILSVGFTGHDMTHLVDRLQTSTDDFPILLAGDMATGPSLVVHAISEGKRAAQAINERLVHSKT
ncbi:MAG: glutamate synthase subunit beta [Phycisphaeraceae bacterium]|nr:glutamate synthase subunit beta [Phycisphaeraceae bacterium]